MVLPGHPLRMVWAGSRYLTSATSTQGSCLDQLFYSTCFAKRRVSLQYAWMRSPFHSAYIYWPTTLCQVLQCSDNLKRNDFVSALEAFMGKTGFKQISLKPVFPIEYQISNQVWYVLSRTGYKEVKDKLQCEHEGENSQFHKGGWGQGSLRRGFPELALEGWTIFPDRPKGMEGKVFWAKVTAHAKTKRCERLWHIPGNCNLLCLVRPEAELLWS